MNEDQSPLALRCPYTLRNSTEEQVGIFGKHSQDKYVVGRIWISPNFKTEELQHCGPFKFTHAMISRDAYA